MPVIDPVKAGRSARKPPPRPKAKKATAAQRRMQAQVNREISKAKPKIDTRDITRTAAGRPRTVTAKAGGRTLRTKVDSGDILHGQAKQPPPARPAKRPSFGRALKEELEGKGTIAKGFERASGPISRALVPSSKPVTIKAHGKTYRTKAPTVAGIPGAPKVSDRGVRVAKDLLNFPAVAIPSAYVPAAAAVEAARGRPQRGKQLLKDLPRTDPVAALVTGHPARALKLADEHPGFAALEAIGVKGAAGRGAGRVLRAAPKTSRVHQVGSTRRADRVGPEGTDLRQRQSYSPDVTRKAAQVAVERHRKRRTAKLRYDADQVAASRPERAAELRAQANRKDPTRMTDNEIRRRVDETVEAREVMRRSNRTAATQEARRAITTTAQPTASAGRLKTIRANRKSKSKPTAATSLHSQAITKASAEDLRAYRDDLVTQYEGLSDAGRQANRILRAQITKAIKANPDPAKLTEAARRYEAVIAPRQQKLAEHGLLAPEQVDKAKLVPYATRHMAATHGKAPTTPTNATRSGLRQAKAERARAGRAVETATRKAAREEGRTRLLVEQRHGRDKTKAKLLTQQAAGLDQQVAALLQRSRANTMGKRATNPLADIGPLTKAQRRYRHKAKRTGVRPQGVQVGSQSYRAGQRQARRAQDLKRRADAMRAEAAAIRDSTVTQAIQPAKALSRLERSRAGLLVAERSREQARQGVTAARDKHAKAKAASRRKPQLLDEHGNPLSAEQIREHMAEHGAHEPAYVTQAPGQRGARNFYIPSDRPPAVGGGARTGKATRQGTFDAHPDVLIEGAARAQGLVDAAEGFAAKVGEFAHKPSLGKLKSKTQADNLARDLEARTATKWRAIRINPFAGRQEQLQALLDKAGEGGIEEHVGSHQPVREAMESALTGADGTGPWALIPDAAAHRMQLHLQNLGAGPKQKAGQVVGSAFRRTVLATSPSWMTGNLTEATMRAALMRAGLRSYVTGKRYQAALDATKVELAAELRARATGGGHFAMADRHHIRRDSSQFGGGAILEPMARVLGRVWATPGPKHIAGAWHTWTDLVFRQTNGRIESAFQTAMLGKALRDSPLMDGALLKTSHKAIEAAAKGTTDLTDIVAFAREIERAYGKYGAFSPDMKWQIATYTPFVAWTINAAKFVADVLPRDHPTATALIASTEQLTEEWRKDHGLDLFIKGALPGFLQGSIPLSGDRHLRAPFRYTPFGAFGDLPATLGNAVLPQLSGVLAAFRGEDWKGKKLVKEDGSPADTLDIAKAAAASFIDATVPIVALAKRVIAKGPKKALNPAEPVNPPADTSGGGDSGNDSGIDLSTLDTDSVDPSSIDLSTIP